MQATDFETILPDAPLAVLPATLTQTPSRSAPVLLAALALPATAAGVVPLGVLVGHVVHDRTLLWTHGGSVAVAALALVLWTVLFALPIARRIWRARRRRTVHLDTDAVVLTDTGWRRERTTVVPLSSYRGLTHRVRTSRSATRHELVLVHPDPTLSVLVRIAPRIAQAEVDRTARLLACREIAPQLVYWPISVERMAGVPRLVTGAVRALVPAAARG